METVFICKCSRGSGIWNLPLEKPHLFAQQCQFPVLLLLKLFNDFFLLLLWRRLQHLGLVALVLLRLRLARLPELFPNQELLLLREETGPSLG